MIATFCYKLLPFYHFPTATEKAKRYENKNYFYYRVPPLLDNTLQCLLANKLANFQLLHSI